MIMINEEVEQLHPYSCIINKDSHILPIQTRSSQELVGSLQISLHRSDWQHSKQDNREKWWSKHPGAFRSPSEVTLPIQTRMKSLDGSANNEILDCVSTCKAEIFLFALEDQERNRGCNWRWSECKELCSCKTHLRWRWNCEDAEA